jgi:hypothetical protein
MRKPKKQLATTIYLDPSISRAIRVKSQKSGRSISDLANEGLKRVLEEDEQHLRIFDERKGERTRSLEEIQREMRRDGLL